MIQGDNINMGGKDWVVPALSFRQLKEHKASINKLGGGLAGEDQLEDVAVVVHAALSRNYPELTRDAVLDLLDLRNSAVCVASIMGQSGLVAMGEAGAGNR